MNMEERWRPKTFDEVVGQDDIIKLIKDKDLRHFFFYGPSGTGKTTVAHLLAKKHDVPIEELNASDDNGIDTVRGTIKNLSETGGKRIILLDEVDNMCLTEDTEIIVGTKKLPSFRSLSDMVIGKKIMIPSVNPETLEIENDKGFLVDSGYTDFFEITLENGEKIKASEKHPFFSLENGKLTEVKLKDLKSGDDLVELDNLFNYCETCGKRTFNQRFCSVSCKNKGHSKDMSGKQNPMFGNTWSPERRHKIVSKLSDGRFKGKNNPNYGGTFHGSNFWDYATPEMIKKLKDSIRETMCKSYKERFGERHLEERLKRHPKADLERIKTNFWINEELKNDYIVCEDCGKKTKTSDNEGIYVHHKDGNHENHTKNNIKFVCPRCHNLVEHDCKSRFLEKGWKITHKPKIVRNGVKIKSIKYIGKKKAWNISMKKNHNFLLANGVLTHNTRPAQAALRRIMENPLSETCFVLTGNDAWKIIKPIKSRCACYPFKRIDDYTIGEHLLKICDAEGVEIDEDAQEGLLTLIEQVDGDMREAINTLEKVIDKDKKITKSAVLTFVKPELSGEALRVAIDGDFEGAQKLMEDAFINSRQDIDQICKELLKSVNQINDKTLKIRLHSALAEAAQGCEDGTNSVSYLIQLTGFIAKAWLLVHTSNECPVLRGAE